jgi:tetratricopeptide (TPR) repeat protein
VTFPAQALQIALRRAGEALVADPAEAERQARAILEANPGEPAAVILLAVARRRQGAPRDAIALLTALARSRPDDPAPHYELGLTLAALGRTELAIAALRQAVALRPDMGPAWGMLADQLFAAGDRTGADAAYGRYFKAPPGDAGLAEVVRAIARGQPETAEPHLARRLEAWPGDVVALGLLADCLRRRSAYPSAIALLRRLLERHPGCVAARFTLADSLHKSGELGAELLDCLGTVIAAEPANAKALGLLGMVRLDLNDAAGAIQAFRAALTHAPGDPHFWVALGGALKYAGWPGEAEAAYRQAVAIAPGHGEAWFRLSDLKSYAFSPGEVASMRAALERAQTDTESRSRIHYALGKERGDAGDAAGAFAHYAEGAALQRTLSPYDPAAEEAQLEEGRRLFTQTFFSTRAGGGSPDPSPIFVVGMPRAGSTLVEQILASHPDVEGTHELSIIPHVVQRLSGEGAAPYHSRLETLSPEERRTLGNEVIAAAAIHRRMDWPRFIDKQPANFQHVGLIHLILPNARIVDIRRHPMASGFAMFKQHFGRGRNFSYDLADIGGYYRRYLDTMRLYDGALPGRTHRVIYEDLVADTEGEIRRLLDYCGLPFAEACLRFHETQREIITPSAEQVRRPIFRDALEEWRAYEPWLQPLQEALGPALTNWRD